MEAKKNDLYVLLILIKKKLWLVLTIIFLCLGASAIFTYFFVTPMYKSSVQMLVKLPVRDDRELSVNDINVNLLIINTYQDFLKKGHIIAEEVQKQLIGTKAQYLSANDITKMVSLANATDSQVITLTVVSENPKIAALVADATAEVLKERTGDLLDIDKLSIIAAAQIPSNPSSPNVKLNLLASIMLGSVLGIGLILLLEFFDGKVKSENDLDSFSFVVLGRISQMTGKNAVGGFDFEDERNKRLRHRAKQRRTKKVTDSIESENTEENSEKIKEFINKLAEQTDASTSDLTETLRKLRELRNGGKYEK